MSPLAHVTELDHGGGVDIDVTEDHAGSPDRLACAQLHCQSWNGEMLYLMDVTSQPLATADLHIRDPRKPLPPATTTRFLTDCDISQIVVGMGLHKP